MNLKASISLLLIKSPADAFSSKGKAHMISFSLIGV
jgi:hypothetical protein